MSKFDKIINFTTYMYVFFLVHGQENGKHETVYPPPQKKKSLRVIWAIPSSTHACAILYHASNITPGTGFVAIKCLLNSKLANGINVH